MIPRAALANITNWINRTHRKPLILRGARQVGKSTLVRMAALACEAVLWEVNLERYPNLYSLFQTRDPQQILRELALILNLPNPGTRPLLLFLDEIQEAPEALVCLRYFYEEMPQLLVVAAGSLLEFTLAKANFSMPVGRVEYLWLGPLDFSEFLQGTGASSLADFLVQWRVGQTIPDALHQKLLEKLREYFLVGGMPEAVQVFAQTGQFTEAQAVHRSILDTYKDDFGKYAQGAALEKLRHVFERAPLLLGQKVKYKNFHPDWKANEIRQALELLERAGIVVKVKHSESSGVPLSTQEDPTVYKLFFVDIGLALNAWGTGGLELSAFLEGRIFEEGKLAEQFAAQALAYSAGRHEAPRLFYWLREGKSTNAEVDFLLTVRQTVIPLEIKAGTSGSLRSLHQFMALKKLGKAVRCDLLPPSAQQVNTTVMTPAGKQAVNYQLQNLPLYLLPFVFLGEF